MDSNYTIGERIAKYRIERGLTQKQLGKLCGLSASYIGDLETGRSKASNIETVCKIAQSLDVVLDLLLFDSLSVYQTDKQENELSLIISSMEKDDIINLIKASEIISSYEIKRIC